MLSRTFLCLLLATLGLGPLCMSARSQGPETDGTGSHDERLEELLDRVWDFELSESPMMATNVGDDRGQDRLADDSLEAIERRTRKRKEFLSELTDIAPASLSDMAQIDHELLKLRLEQQLADYRFKTYLMPINNREGFHISFPELPRLT